MFEQRRCSEFRSAARAPIGQHRERLEERRFRRRDTKLARTLLVTTPKQLREHEAWLRQKLAHQPHELAVVAAAVTAQVEHQRAGVRYAPQRLFDVVAIAH